MEINLDRNDTRLELRVLELEDTVRAMASILGTMSEMLGHLNQIAGHYADTVVSAVATIPDTARRMLPLTHAEGPEKSCTGGCCGANGACSPTDR